MGAATAERRRPAKEAPDPVATAGFTERYPHQMNGDQQQLVALARAFVAKALTSPEEKPAT